MRFVFTLELLSSLEDPAIIDAVTPQLYLRQRTALDKIASLDITPSTNMGNHKQLDEYPLSPPSLEEIVHLLKPALESNYKESSVSVASCPDLREAPFHLAAQGLSGRECIADIGGTYANGCNPSQNFNCVCRYHTNHPLFETPLVNSRHFLTFPRFCRPA